MRVKTLILDNVRSAHNVGSIIRTASGLGVTSIISVGITPHLEIAADARLPHIIARSVRQIKKTSLGAEKDLKFGHVNNFLEAVQIAKNNNLVIVAIETGKNSAPIQNFAPLLNDLAIVVGNEREGISEKNLSLCDSQLSIPMHGSKNSFNVSVSAAIAIYALNEYP